MLKPKVLPQILKQANTGGVKCTMLFKTDGSLLAAACPHAEDSNAKIVAAIVSNLWSSFEKGGELEYQLIEFEEGKLLATKINKLLLCIYGDQSVEFGMLKTKAQSLRSYLEGPMKQIMP